jgi:hypothetical protein
MFSQTCEVVRLPRQRRGLEYWSLPKNRCKVGKTSSKRKKILNLREDSGESEYDDDSEEEARLPRTFQRTMPTGFSVNACASSHSSSDAESMHSSFDQCEDQLPIERVSVMRRSPSGASQMSDSTLSSAATRAADRTATRVGVARQSRVERGSKRAPTFDRRQAPCSFVLPRMNWVEDESGVLSPIRLAPKSGACVPSSFA